MEEVNEVQTKEDSHLTVFDSQYGSRQVLDLLAEKWTALVLYALALSSPTSNILVACGVVGATPQAVQTWNESEGTAIGLFHMTC